MSWPQVRTRRRVVRTPEEIAEENTYRRGLVAKAKQGDHKALMEYQQLNLGLIESIVRAYAKWVSDNEIADLRQEAHLGLWKGIQAYDTEKSPTGKPEGYIFSWVRAYVSNYAKTWGLANESKKVSIDNTDEESDELSLLDQMADEGPTASERYDEKETAAWIEELTAGLLPKEKVIAKRRLFAEEPETLQDLGNEIGISRERVRQIEIGIRKKLKDRIAKKAG